MRAIFLSFLLCSPATGAELESVAPAGISWGRGWGAGSDTEIKTSLDKKARTDGYELASDTSVTKELGGGWGALAGLVWKRERHEDLDYDVPAEAPTGKKKKAVTVEKGPRFTSRNFVDSFYVGPTLGFRAWGRPVNAELTYNRVGEEVDALKNGFDSYVVLDVRSKAKLNRWAKLKTRWKYSEFLRTRAAEGTDTRASKLEISPAVYYRAASLGLQNRLNSKFKVGSNRNTVDVAPFLKLEKGAFELTVRTIFTPLVSGDGQTFAPGWASHPVYSAELEVAL